MAGSDGEHELQEKYQTKGRACAFYNSQMIDRLIPTMVEFISKQEMVFVSTADAKGNCDSSFRAGKPGFIEVLDEKTLRYPEYNGNGVFASLGNISENPHIGLMFIDFFEHTVGLHVNGTASIEERVETDDPLVQRWVVVGVEEAYMHCSKHIPLLKKLDKEMHWGSDHGRYKGGEFFGVRPYLKCKVCYGQKICQHKHKHHGHCAKAAPTRSPDGTGAAPDPHTET